MFVSKARYDALQAQLVASKLETLRLVLEHKALAKKWNDLVEQINAKGGQEFLDGGLSVPFTFEELATLIMLCHPDRHGGKESATRMTQRLLEMRDQLS